MVLTYENLQVLNLIQALLGNVTDNLRVVAITCSTQDITLHFVLEREQRESREDIEDIFSEFEVLQSSGVRVNVEVIINEGELDLSVLPPRLVFLRK